MGVEVRVRHKGHVYRAKIVKHILPGSAAETNRHKTGASTSGDVSDASCSSPSSTTATTKSVNVMESGARSEEIRYRVHYAGWNVRHDEIIPRERIMCVVVVVYLHLPQSYSSSSCSLSSAAHFYCVK